MNAGKLRQELHTKANTQLAPHGVEIPTFAEMGGWVGGDEGDGATASTDGGPATTSADAGQAPAGAKTDAPDAPAAKAQAAEPLALKAEGTLLVTVIASSGSSVAEGDRLVGFYLGTQKQLERKLALEREVKTLTKQAKRKGKRGRKARKKLKATKRDHLTLLTKLEAKKLTADRPGKVLEVKAKRGTILSPGDLLLTWQPSP